MSPVKPIPEGFHSLTPHLCVSDTRKAIDFYKQAFGAKELSYSTDPNGKCMHAEIQIGDSRLMLNDEYPEMGGRGPKLIGGSPVTIHLYVADADAVFNQAVAGGAKAIMPMSDMFWGDRFGHLEDPFGHRWSVATHKEDLTPEQMNARMREQMAGSHGCGEVNA